MRWNRGHRSPDLQDRRAQGPARFGLGGRGGGLGGLAALLPLIGRFGWKGILIIGAVIGLLMYSGQCGLGGGGGGGGNDPVGKGAPQGEQVATMPGEGAATEDELISFVGFVFDDAQATWVREFEQRGDAYPRAGIIVFREAVASDCGHASSDVGPFYCPLDQDVYIDLSFYRELRQRFGAPGDFAQAYVIAHEVGHHVQRARGVLEGEAIDGADPRGAAIDVELQADCLAGAWAKHAEQRELLEAGDLEEAMDAAAAIGDDAIQQKMEGRIRPERWTHGSSAQRQQAFRRGYQGGSLAACGL